MSGLFLLLHRFGNALKQFFNALAMGTLSKDS